jgi:hypothetical protein
MPDYMLSDVKSLSNLVIPPTVSYIGDNAMTGMTALKSINVTSLTAVPELGTDVWHNVDQSAVTVSALEDIADEFQAADQWREFSYNVETGVADNLTAAKASVKGRFDGNVLQIIASGCDLKCVTLFDVAGATLTTAYVNADSASISTADFSSRIYIVNVSLSNGDSATLKLIRK